MNVNDLSGAKSARHEVSDFFLFENHLIRLELYLF